MRALIIPLLIIVNTGCSSTDQYQKAGPNPSGPPEKASGAQPPAYGSGLGDNPPAQPPLLHPRDSGPNYGQDYYQGYGYQNDRSNGPDQLPPARPVYPSSQPQSAGSYGSAGSGPSPYYQDTRPGSYEQDAYTEGFDDNISEEFSPPPRKMIWKGDKGGSRAWEDAPRREIETMESGPSMDTEQYPAQ